MPEVSVEQLKQIKNPCLIDVREKGEWDKGHIEGAQHWPLSKINEGYLPSFRVNQEVVLYCQRGQRSLKAASILKASGQKNISSMIGGYEDWLAHGGSTSDFKHTDTSLCV